MAVTDLNTTSLADGSLNNWRRAWDVMDRVYFVCGYLAAFSMFMIFALTMMQMVGRYVEFNPAGITNYVGYLTGATTFLALSHGLNQGAHVRVGLFLSLLGRFRIYGESLGLCVSFIVGAWFSWYCWQTVYDSYRFGDVSDGLDATPLWVPQIAMAVGMTLFAVAICDHFIRLLVTGNTGIKSTEEPV